MKKRIYLILISISCLCCWACGSKSTTTKDPSPTEAILTPEPTKEPIITEAPLEDFNPTEWGVQEKLISEANGNRARAYIRFPEYAGVMKGTGKVSYEVLSTEESTLIILDTQTEDVLDVLEGKAENILPAYFAETKDILVGYRTMAYSNFEFHITNRENVTINDYEMCKYIGTHTFTVREATGSVEYCLNFVAYATKLKTNGAYVYWMVIDESKNQTLGSYIEEQALKMAKTLYDE